MRKLKFLVTFTVIWTAAETVTAKRLLAPEMPFTAFLKEYTKGQLAMYKATVDNPRDAFKYRFVLGTDEVVRINTRR